MEWTGHRARVHSRQSDHCTPTVCAPTFGDAGLPCSVRQRILDNRFVKVETTPRARSGTCGQGRMLGHVGIQQTQRY